MCIAISGIINPERKELRELAKKYGATYEPDISRKVTHLISISRRTPKSLKA